MPASWVPPALPGRPKAIVFRFCSQASGGTGLVCGSYRNAAYAAYRPCGPVARGSAGGRTSRGRSTTLAVRPSPLSNRRAGPGRKRKSVGKAVKRAVALQRWGAATDRDGALAGAATSQVPTASGFGRQGCMRSAGRSEPRHPYSASRAVGVKPAASPATRRAAAIASRRAQITARQYPPKVPGRPGTILERLLEMLAR